MVSDSNIDATLLVELRPVRWRLSWQGIAKRGVTGLAWGSCVSLTIALTILIMQRQGVFNAATSALLERLAWSVASLPAVSAVLGMAVGCFSLPTWHQAARFIDLRFELKDRMTAALAAACSHHPTAIDTLVVDDAVRHMRRINLNQAAPWPALRWVVGSAALWCAAAALVAIPVWRQQAVASATHQRQQRTDSYRAESAARLEQTMLSQLRELAEATDGDVPMTKALQTLQDQVKRQLEQLAKPGHSDRETLATLSQIHRAVSETRASMDADVAARSLKTLANVLASAESLEAVNVAVEEEDFAEAAHRLSEWNPQRLSELERQTLVDQLNPVAATVKKTGEKKLAEATEQLRDGLAQRDDQRAAAASRTIAQQMSRQALRMKIQQTLDRQLTQLAEAKGLGRSGGDDTTPSDQSRETWGRGRDGEPLGDESERLATTRQRKTLSGTLGEGPANRQQMAANQLDGDVERDYQSIPQRKFDEVEQVLREEALPIGHRQTIRNYFQTLREHTE